MTYTAQFNVTESALPDFAPVALPATAGGVAHERAEHLLFVHVNALLYEDHAHRCVEYSGGAYGIVAHVYDVTSDRRMLLGIVEITPMGGVR